MNVETMIAADRMAHAAAKDGVAVTVPFLLDLIAGFELTNQDVAPTSPYVAAQPTKEKSFCASIRYAVGDAQPQKRTVVINDVSTLETFLDDATVRAVFADIFGGSKEAR